MTDTAHYCPVTGGPNHFSLAYWDGSCTFCPNNGVSSYGSTYRDYLTLVSGTICGRFTDGEIANALNSQKNVVYANGAGGFPILGVGDIAKVVANACSCAGAAATEQSTWGALKALYR